ncbi:MAG: hypothetical protein JKX87_06270 [Cycloclasticus sp.]|nr:hypothetical protein [Cycloclasticus sp.]
MRLVRHKSLFFALAMAWMMVLLAALITISSLININITHLTEVVSMMMTIIAVLFVWVYDYTLKDTSEDRRSNDVY